jgi:hypothetical protein
LVKNRFSQENESLQDPATRFLSSENHSWTSEFRYPLVFSPGSTPVILNAHADKRASYRKEFEPRYTRLDIFNSEPVYNLSAGVWSQRRNGYSIFQPRLRNKHTRVDSVLTAEDVAKRLKVSRDTPVLGRWGPVLCANPCIVLEALTYLFGAQTGT